jgi:hypothetical protein
MSSFRWSGPSVETIEGPHWDFSRVNDYAVNARNMYAILTARYFMEGDLEWARRHGDRFLAAEALCASVTARYDATKDLDIRWIGWH